MSGLFAMFSILKLAMLFDLHSQCNDPDSSLLT